MRLVELVAPAGAGKSALVAAALRRGRAAGIVDARSLVRPGRVAGAARLAHALPTALARGRLLDVLLGGPDDDAVAAALAQVAGPWADLLDLVTSPPPARTSSDAVLTLLERRWFIEALGLRACLELALADAAADPRAALLDEGLLHPHKIDGAVGDDDARRERYRRAVPLPDLVVGLEVPSDIIVERLDRRARARPHHPRWSRPDARGHDALAMVVERGAADVARTIAVAAERGASVLTIDGTLAPDEQGALLLDAVVAVAR